MLAYAYFIHNAINYAMPLGDGMNMNGGQVDRTLRNALCSLVLVGERDQTWELASIADRNDNLTSKYAVYRFDFIFMCHSCSCTCGVNILYVCMYVCMCLFTNISLLK